MEPKSSRPPTDKRLTPQSDPLIGAQIYGRRHNVTGDA